MRLTKWFVTIPTKEKNKIVKDATQLVLARRVKMCNFLEYKGKTCAALAGLNDMTLLTLYHCIFAVIDQKIVYRR